MFGSLATPNDVTQEHTSMTSTKDPWNDTSLIEFWQKSISSYKCHHTNGSTQDPLLELQEKSNKRTESMSSAEETPTTKKLKTDHPSSSNMVTSIRTPVKDRTKEDTDIGNVVPAQEEEKEEEEQIEEEQVEEEEEKEGEQLEADAEDINQDDNEAYEDDEQYPQAYDDGSQYQQYYQQQGYQYPYYSQPSSYYHHPYQQQQQQQPSMPPPPPMPFAPPPSAAHRHQSNQDNEALTNLIMAWYYSGYYTGLYQAQQEK